MARLLLLVPALLLAACADPSPETDAPEPLEAASEIDALSNAGASGDAEAPTPGSLAPAFTLADTNGQEHALADFRGQVVVLEWLNYDCPYVQKHYGGGNMQALQERFTDEGVVWLSVVSSAPGEQGHFSPDDMNARTATEGGVGTAVLLDPTGEVGRMYDAQTTPQMVVIDADGRIAYNGAIDDQPVTNPASLETAASYVVPAIAAAQQGRTADPATTQPYGCSVKYGPDA